MRTIRFPRPQRLARVFLETQLAAFGKAQPVSTKNPSTLPHQWIRLKSDGGPRSFTEWQVMLETFVYADDETVAEDNAVLVHSLMLDAPGVDMLAPEWAEAFPWVRMARHISGPQPLEPDVDLPNLEVFRIVTTWHVLPIPS